MQQQRIRIIGLAIFFLLMFSGVTIADSDSNGVSEEIGEFLGGLSGWLITVAACPFVIRRINKHLLNNKNTWLTKLNKMVSKAHTLTGFLSLAVALLHGYIAEGTIFILNTGATAWWILLLLSLVAVIGKKIRFKMWLRIHRVLAALFIFAVLIHLTVA